MRRLLTIRCRRPAAIAAAMLLIGPGAALAEPGGSQDVSLERLLMRLRRTADEHLAPMRKTVEKAVVELERLEPPRAEAARIQRQRLIDLGPSAAPLLVPWLEPDRARTRREDPDQDQGGLAGDLTPEAFRAQQFALALRELPNPAVTDRLLVLARHGTPEARNNALVALSTSSEPARVQAVVHEIYATAEGALRRRALDTLKTLGGPRDVFIEALAKDDDELIEVALSALTGHDNPTYTPPVIVLLQSTHGPRHVQSILRYFRQSTAKLDEDSVKAVIGVLLTNRLRPEDKAGLLDTLSRLDVRLDPPLKKRLDPLANSSSEEVSEATLILLARQRDSRARRQLLEPYDNAIERSKNRPNVYSRRAEIHYRVRDLRSAIKDYKRAVELARGNRVDEVPLLGLARCFALQGKFKDAATYLERAPISVATLHELATDPDFAEMVQDKIGRAAFRLPEEKPSRNQRSR